MLDMLRGMSAHDDGDQVRCVLRHWHVACDACQGGVNSPTSVGSMKMEDALTGNRGIAVVMPGMVVQSWLSPLAAAEAACDHTDDASASASASAAPKRTMQRRSHIQDTALHRYVMDEAADANAQADALLRAGGDNDGDAVADRVLDVNMHT